MGYLPDRFAEGIKRECVRNDLSMVGAQKMAAGKMMMKIILNFLLSGLKEL